MASTASPPITTTTMTARAITVQVPPIADKILDIFNTALGYVHNFITLNTDGFYLLWQNIGERTPDWLKASFLTFIVYTANISLVCVAITLLGATAFHAVLYCFQIAGLSTPVLHNAMLTDDHKIDEQIAEEDDDHEALRQQLLKIARKKAKREVERGAAFLWRASTIVFFGLLFYLRGTEEFWALVVRAYLYSAALFNFLPLVVTAFASMVLPKAYIAEAWLCKRRDQKHLENLKLKAAGGHARFETKAEKIDRAEVKRSGYEGRKKKYVNNGALPSGRF